MGMLFEEADQESAKIERRLPRRNHSDRSISVLAVEAGVLAVITIQSPFLRKGS